MYWPVGAPRIYAACTANSRDTILQFEDDAESRQTTESSEALLDVPGSRSDSAQDEDDSLLGVTPSTPLTPHTPAIAPVEHDTPRRLSAKSSGKLGEHLEDAVRDAEKQPILGLRLSRPGHLFAVITATSMTIWQTKPTVVLAVVVRSATSLSTYGPNVSVLVRPDSAIFVVQTTLGYLITYSLASDPDALVYRPHFPDNTSVNTRRQSNFTGARNQGDRILWGPGEGSGVREISIRFRMVIKVDAGIEKVLALDEELVVATEKPAAIQCIRWTPDSKGQQTNTELLSRMSWLPKKATVVDMIYDRPMNLSAWITSDGKAFAVQRITDSKQPAKLEDQQDSSTFGKKLFGGYCFHDAESENSFANKVAINARFSLIAVGCSDCSIAVYTAKDYVGNIPLSHKQKLGVSSKTSGKLTCLSYSPDGYCLFAGYEHGWAMWSVFGKPGSTSFASDQTISNANGEGWLNGVKEANWLGSGAEILLVGQNDDRLWVLEMARSAISGCFTPANISRAMLQTRTGVMIYRGYDQSDLTTISAEASLWHHAQIPSNYLNGQWPIKCSVISPDGRYVAVSGRRGLAHYSVNSGRWKTFVNGSMENEFQVRGGMCWHQHILVVAVEAGDLYEIRLYSREAALDSSLVLHVEQLPTPVVLLAPSGEDSLLVYTTENLLYHYVFSSSGGSVRLIQVGQIAFHGIVRSPARVRGLSWVLPDYQIQDGDPSQDVVVATVIFLVDGKLVLLQPSLNDEHQLKYDMRVIAQNVEYYALMRDQIVTGIPMIGSTSSPQISGSSQVATNGLRDSLWIFDGNEMKAWPDVQDILKPGLGDYGHNLPSSIGVTIDFYPLSILLNKGILLGVEPDLVQRRDVGFAFFRFSIRTHLFVPQILKYHLSRYDSASALHTSHQYQNLEYFPHALEVLLHDVLDEEVDNPRSVDQALLPGVLSFLSSFPQYLDIVVQCTRKTEVRSWRTLFQHLPPPAELFEESLQRGSLKTAGGYLLVLHTFEELSSSSEQLVRLLARAKNEGDWELCKELARFLVALDESGATLKEALELVDLRSPEEGRGSSFLFEGSRLKPFHSKASNHSQELPTNGQRRRSSGGSRSPRSTSENGASVSREDNSLADYFSTHVT